MRKYVFLIVYLPVLLFLFVAVLFFLLFFVVFIIRISFFIICCCYSGLYKAFWMPGFENSLKTTLYVFLGKNRRH